MIPHGVTVSAVTLEPLDAAEQQRLLELLRRLT
jgi:hypothetical protein